MRGRFSMSQNKPQVGYLRSCMDRRFLAPTRQAFEQIARLGATEYYHEAFAGGTLGVQPEVNGAQYVYDRSFKHEQDFTLIYMGWQVHLDHCGGLPGKTDPQIEEAFRDLIYSGDIQRTYPQVRHVFFVAQTKNGQPAVEVISMG